MSFKRILYSQALDNQSPNSILADGQWLEKDDEQSREQAMSVISMVAERGQIVREFVGLKVIEAPSSGVIIEYSCLNKDVLGRNSFIVFCDCDGSLHDLDFSLQMHQEVVKFATELNRKLVTNSLPLLSPNPLRSKRRWGIGTPVAVIAVGLIIITAALITLSTSNHNSPDHRNLRSLSTMEKEVVRTA